MNKKNRRIRNEKHKIVIGKLSIIVKFFYHSKFQDTFSFPTFICLPFYLKFGDQNFI